MRYPILVIASERESCDDVQLSSKIQGDEGNYAKETKESEWCDSIDQLRDQSC